MSDSRIDVIDRSTLHKGGRTGVLLIHGLGGSPVEVRYIAQGLARAGFTVLCCQLAGHCSTAEELRNTTWQDWQRSVAEAHDRLKKECDIIIAGGLSTGALLAVDLAHARPDEVHGLTLFSPSIYLDGWAMPWYMRWLHYVHAGPIRVDFDLTERAPYGLKDERIRAMVVSSMQSGSSKDNGFFFTPLWTVLQFNKLAAKVRRNLSQVSTPTLILHPREDDVASLKNALEIQRKMSGIVELLVLEDSYHIITLDKQRQLVLDRTAAFAQQIERQELARRQPKPAITRAVSGRGH
jgi:carboxylesterase